MRRDRLVQWATRAARISGVRAALAAMARRRRRSLVLLYHRVGRPGRRQHEVVPTLDSDLFRAQLEALAAIGRFVPLSDLLEPSESEVRFSVTFDDDWAGYVDSPLEVLLDLSIPATFFLGGRALHGRGATWWEVLEHRILTHGLSQVAHDLGLEARHPRQLASQVLLDGMTATLTDSWVAASTSTASDIESLVNAGMEIGFHTVDHVDLTRIPPSEVDKALQFGRTELEETVGRPIRYFAYPYGAVNGVVRGRAQAAGYEAAFTAFGGPMTSHGDRWLADRWEPGDRGPEEVMSEVVVRLNKPLAARRITNTAQQ